MYLSAMHMLQGKVNGRLDQLDLTLTMEHSRYTATQRELLELGRSKERAAADIFALEQSIAKLEVWIQEHQQASSLSAAAHVRTDATALRAIELTSHDHAIDDVIYALQQFLDAGHIDVEVWKRMVRRLARSQFGVRRELNQLGGVTTPTCTPPSVPASQVPTRDTSSRVMY
eukprot:TRINITY_DN7020_c0_g1_i2.p1 TRINITY_DN7020_c0_g1~~TRINITY_DN7020_c0_g1_i2.p1  ORF type:complete len:172 (-),score=25.43 TRINITY_DN7020_c0_g1_i2:170-685(-)